MFPFKIKIWDLIDNPTHGEYRSDKARTRARPFTLMFTAAFYFYD